ASARGSRWVIRSATVTWRVARSSIASWMSRGLPPYDDVIVTSSRHTALNGISTFAVGSEGAKNRTVPPRSTDPRPWTIAFGAPVHVITYFARRPSLASRTFAGTSSRPSLTTSAPAFRAATFRYSTMSVAITFAAPDAFASFTWRSPATPLPLTTTVRPGRNPAKRCPRTTQAKGSTKTPSSSEIPFGNANTPCFTLTAGTRTNSANPPGSKFVVRSVSHTVSWPARQYRHWPHGTWWDTNTRSPTLTRSTPAPTSTTSAAISWPRTSGAFGLRYHSITSEPQIPLERTLTRICTAPIRGCGRCTSRTSSFA